MRVCVVAEYYPNAHDPSHGIWAHRQALAAREAGAEVRVVVLHRPLPPLAALRRPGSLGPWLRRELAQAGGEVRDGIEVLRVEFVSPPRPLSYASWGWWAAPAIGRALGRLHRKWPFDLVHAHYAVPAGRAARGFARSRGLPLVVSEHGAGVYDVARRSERARRRVAEVLSGARLVLCNSRGVGEAVERLGVAPERLRVVHLGAEPPADAPAKLDAPTLVTSGYLVARKRHRDVLRALALLRDELPEARYRIVGDGPERPRLERLARELGLAGAVELRGRLEPRAALRAVAECHLMAMPSLDEAFGVAYVEAMAAGLPAVGCAGEAGPEEIAALAGGDGGMVLVPARDPAALAGALRELLGDRERLQELGERARETALAHFSWRACGEATVAAYRDALAGTMS